MINFIAIISLSMICCPFRHLDKNSISKDVMPANLINNNTTLRKYKVGSFSQFKFNNKKWCIRSDFGRKLLISSHFSHLQKVYKENVGVASIDLRWNDPFIQQMCMNPQFPC